MNARQITTTDIVKLTGYTRHQVRKLLESLLVFNDRTKVERVASQFSMAELVTIVIFCELESVYGVRRELLSLLSTEMLNIFSTARDVSNTTAKLIINMRENKILYKNSVTDIDDGIVLPLKRIFDRIHEYLLGPMFYGQGIQQHLNLELDTTISDVEKLTYAKSRHA